MIKSMVACNTMPVLLLLIFSVVHEATASSATSAPMIEGRSPLWARPGDRNSLRGRHHAKPLSVVVAKDGSGNYSTITAAVAAVPRGKAQYVIHVKRGTYEEQVKITRKNVMLVGEGAGLTVISGNLSVKKHGLPTPLTATLIAEGDDFTARDLTIMNTAGPDGEQAVALRSSSNRSVFYRCQIKGFQDTLLAEKHIQFYRECEISGTVDFVFGDATAVFQNCLILARRPSAGQHNVITAQGRDAPERLTGFSFQNCTVTTREDLNGVDTYLGRPWKNYSLVVFMQSFLDRIVHPEGWVPWEKDVVEKNTTRTIVYAEYMNWGPGADTRPRVIWRGFHVIQSVDEAAAFTVERLINGGQWLPSRGVVFTPGLI